MIAAMALAAGAAFAETAPITSANVVGFVSQANLVANKFYLIASHFQDTATGGSIDLQQFITSPDMVGGDSKENSPNIKIWVGDHYNDYYFYLEDELYGDENVWVEDGTTAENVEVDLAVGAFLKVKNNCTITVAGQVADAAALNVPLVAGKNNLIANPFPVAFDINDGTADFASALVGGDSKENAPNMKIWVGDHYNDYYFYAEDELYGDENVWVEDGTTAEDVVVEPGHGFWIKYTNSKDNVELLFNKVTPVAE